MPIWKCNGKEKVNNNQKKRIYFKILNLLLVIILVFSVASVGGCSMESKQGAKGAKSAGKRQSEDARFEEYTAELFCKEVSANTVSLHYTLKAPEKYGIEATDATFGQFEREPEAVKAAVETVIGQCRAFLEMGNGNYLYSTFTDRVMELNTLTEKEKSDYIQENALAISDYVFPAYERMTEELEQLKGSGKNEKGLVYFPKGKEYYELLARQSTGSRRSVEELKDLTRRQINEDLTAMEQVLGLTTKEAKEAAAVITDKKAEQILEQLKEGSKTAFPEPPQTKLEVKYVPEAMEEHLSPAFYMIPAIDNSQQNVIYINRARMGNDMTLFTTLAHEGYPGHLYQTIYYESTHPDPIRSLLDFGGYVEGWATYAEMGSYYLMGLSKEQATLLQKNASIILALYALADIGIHYDGWSVEDTEAFFKNYGITDKDAVGEIYKLILGSPANYLKYYIGYVEFLELKKMWVDEKGKDFLQKEFHSAVLKIGPAPFEIVEDYMWKM